MNETDITQLWVYLSTKPLTGLTITLVAYAIGFWLYQKSNRNPICNPVVIAIALIAFVLHLTGTPYAAYFEGAQFVHFLLGPATVALAVPLFRQTATLKRALPVIVFGVLFGSLVASASTVILAWALGASPETLASLAPKSVTTPVAMGIAEEIGGVPALTAVCVIATGIVGATLGPMVMNMARLKDWRARGFAMGVAAHGIGTARAFQVNETAGAFSGLAMGLNTMATALTIPFLWHWIFG
ncbi:MULTISPECIES: LrgB family protein [Thalassospira]|jgi:predicted murein hydrolase (TIGR00659 family)|uniref:Membrane protein n=2 Tax=Thalassospira TaxID=168934 RepID=A0A367WH76_9PROT|nr:MULTISPECIES: LrgB family protein [Thalassospira]MDG4718864.1 LrgB family protein [Thalassospira sp. FZY0004]RCK39832.1 membrane protein [Thalassospira profundimaris]